MTNINGTGAGETAQPGSMEQWLRDYWFAGTDADEPESSPIMAKAREQDARTVALERAVAELVAALENTSEYWHSVHPRYGPNIYTAFMNCQHMSCAEARSAIAIAKGGTEVRG